MTNEEILTLYKTLVPFIANLLGPSSEVLLHDVSNPEHSVVAISNGHLSGRGIGSPLTDFARELIASNAYSDQPYLTNYSGSCKGRSFTSSTYFIKNEDVIIGMLCINRDMHLISDFSRIVEALKTHYNLNAPSNDVIELLDETPVDQIIHSMIQKAINDYGISSTRLSKNERISIVQRLKELGAFNIKGAVGEIAGQLHVSEPTLYRYLNSKE